MHVLLGQGPLIHLPLLPPDEVLCCVGNELWVIVLLLDEASPDSFGCIILLFVRQNRFVGIRIHSAHSKLHVEGSLSA